MEWIYPVSNTLPMGWTGSVLVGQLFHEKLVAEYIESKPPELEGLTMVNLADEEAVRKSRLLDVDKVVFYLVYVDDVSVFHFRRSKVNEVLQGLFDKYVSAGMVVKDSKTVWATRALRVLGVWVDLVNNIVRPIDENLIF